MPAASIQAVRCAGHKFRDATMHARRAYYNNSGVDASGRFRYGAPPPASPRFDGEQMLWSVIGANTFIFALWHAVDPRFMQANFTVSERSVYTGSVHTMVTAAFSHYDLTQMTGIANTAHSDTAGCS